MPSVSKAQQRFMGMVHAYKKGELKGSEASQAIKDAAKGMKKKSAKDYASTKHKGLPKKVKNEIDFGKKLQKNVDKYNKRAKKSKASMKKHADISALRKELSKLEKRWVGAQEKMKSAAKRGDTKMANKWKGTVKKAVTNMDKVQDKINAARKKESVSEVFVIQYKKDKRYLTSKELFDKIPQKFDTEKDAKNMLSGLDYQYRGNYKIVKVKESVNEAKLTDDTLASRIKHWAGQHKGTGVGYGHVLGSLAIHMKEMGWDKSFKEVVKVAKELSKKKKVESVNEGKWSKIMTSVRKGSKAGPWSIVVYDKAKRKVIHNRIVKILQQIPAHYEDVKKKYPRASIGIEDKYGHRVYTESVNEAKANIYGVDFLEKMTDKKFKKSSLTMSSSQGLKAHKNMTMAIMKKAEKLRKQEGWAGYRITVNGQPYIAGHTTRFVKYPRPHINDSVNEAKETGTIKKSGGLWWAVFNKRKKLRFEGNVNFMVKALKIVSGMSKKQVIDLLKVTVGTMKGVPFKADFSKDKYVRTESVDEAKETGIDIAKRVVKNKQHEKGLDLTTANFIVKIYDAYKEHPNLQRQMDKMPLPKMVKLAYKVMN